MPQKGIPAAFFRGGTSRGLILRPEHIAPFAPATRERIITSALGSPDPAGRQISGLGGGVSSLSKVAIVGVPGEGRDAQEVFGKLPGVPWADDGHRGGESWDVVYRFGQVPVKNADPIDWSASCGNMVAAAALTAVGTPIIPYSTLFMRSRTLPAPSDGSPLLFPLSILSASNGVLMHARVPIDPVTLLPWEPEEGEGVEIAGVPGRDEPGIEIEMPLEFGNASAKGGLVTGRAKDIVKLDDGSEVTVSILTSGLPNLFLPISSLLSLTSVSLPADLLTLPSSTLDAHPTLPALLERIRVACAERYNLPLSLASPKITLVGPVPERYETSSGTSVAKGDADLLVRAISSGDFHATVPGTTLGAVNIGMGTPGSVIHELVYGPEGEEKKVNVEVVTVRAAHAAGVASSSVKFVAGEPQSVVMVRTAREIMRGEVMIPRRVFASEGVHEQFE
ncbi:hypothetical protein JCM1841_006921 [Sporobolomyces salmonicolor]